MAQLEHVINRIHTADNVPFMRGLPDSCIDLTVTSPPYDNLRTYNGFTFDFEAVADELYRITKEGGVVVWVVGDATIKGSETLTSFKQALYFREIGFNVHDTMIYVKNGGLRHSPKIPRYSQDFEYMFVLTKGAPKDFNAIMTPCATAGEKLASSKRQRQTNGDLKSIVGATGEVNTMKRKGNVWTYDVGYNKTTKDAYAYDHPAIFPEQLAHDHIVSWSQPGDIVFDPFAGSGTTLKMAVLADRRFIGVDISEEYVEIANRRVNDALETKGEAGE